ncbi:hypothetical protein IWZ03DRAFT_100557 [Phyllosticta citriasiana]|uniref:Secreted protein n=1 Tax=Phyllosticta citriasiana TaxID=595635 RepID=A0ABR1KU98_9PEZI
MIFLFSFFFFATLWPTTPYQGVFRRLKLPRRVIQSVSLAREGTSDVCRLTLAPFWVHRIYRVSECCLLGRSVWPFLRVLRWGVWLP